MFTVIKLTVNSLSRGAKVESDDTQGPLRGFTGSLSTVTVRQAKFYLFCRSYWGLVTPKRSGPNDPERVLGALEELPVALKGTQGALEWIQGHNTSM